jgi:hypothetical protein
MLPGALAFVMDRETILFAWHFGFSSSSRIVVGAANSKHRLTMG